MSPEAALKEARLLGQLDQFNVSRHAIQRMDERNVMRADIASAMKNATAASADGDRWCLSGGLDLEGDPLVVVVDLGSRLVVTVM